MGVARSGMSIVAGLLHEAFGINMNPTEIGPNQLNPKGCYEDHEFHNLVAEIRKQQCAVNISYLESMFAKRKEPWGFKSNLTHWVWNDWLKQHFLGVRIVFVTRCNGEIVESRAHQLKLDKTLYSIGALEKSVMEDKKQLCEVVNNNLSPSTLITFEELTMSERTLQGALCRLAAFTRMPCNDLKAYDFVEHGFSTWREK
jgi:hypothetical protein